VSQAHSFEYELSQELAERAAEAFLRTRARRVPLDARCWRAMSILLLCALVSAALAGMGYLAQVPVALAFVPLALLGLFGGVLSLAAISFLIGTTIVGLSRWLIRRRLIAGIPHSQDRTVRWTFTDEWFHAQTADKTRQVPWTAIRRVLVDPDFWFLQLHDGPELVLPVVNLSAEVRDLISKRAGGLPPASLQIVPCVQRSGRWRCRCSG
jgi:hypothetical protein